MDRRRAGLSFIEVAVATVLIAALLAGVAQALSLVAQQRRASLYRMIATEEAANIVERVAVAVLLQSERDLDGAVGVQAQRRARAEGVGGQHAPRLDAQLRPRLQRGEVQPLVVVEYVVR